MRKIMLFIFLVLGAAVISLTGQSAPENSLQWQQMADLPRPVAGYMAGVVQGKMLLVGGSYWENKKKHWSDLVQVFDPKANSWQNAAPLPEPRSDAASASLHDKLYIFGGGAESNVRRDALVLDHGTWKPVPAAELPEPRLYAVAIALQDSIYLLGGIAKAGDYKNMSNAFWRWSEKSHGWEVLPALPGPGRISHAMAVIDGEIYVFGGAGSGAQDVENLKDVYKFNPKAKTWTRLPDLPAANRAWWAVGLPHRALLLAGYTDNFVREVRVYDLKTGVQATTALPQGLADTKFFRVGNVVVGAGGESGPGVRGKWTFQAEIPVNWRK